jgi:hypothetical protein
MWLASKTIAVPLCSQPEEQLLLCAGRYRRYVPVAIESGQVCGIREMKSINTGAKSLRSQLDRFLQANQILALQ